MGGAGVLPLSPATSAPPRAIPNMPRLRRDAAGLEAQLLVVQIAAVGRLELLHQPCGRRRSSADHRGGIARAPRRWSGAGAPVREILSWAFDDAYNIFARIGALSSDLPRGMGNRMRRGYGTGAGAARRMRGGAGPPMADENRGREKARGSRSLFGRGSAPRDKHELVGGRARLRVDLAVVDGVAAITVGYLTLERLPCRRRIVPVFPFLARDLDGLLVLRDLEDDELGRGGAQR